MATPARRMSVKDRIKMVEKEEKKHGNEQLLKTFSAGTKTENDDDELNESVTTTTHNNCDNVELLAESTDTESFESTTTTTTIVKDKDNEEEVSPAEEGYTPVKDRVSSITADLRAQSEQKKQEYLQVRSSAQNEIEKLQNEIEKNNLDLIQLTIKSPELRSHKVLENVDRIRLEQGKNRQSVRIQLNRQVESAKERICTLLQEQRALHDAWEEYTEEESDV